jgi:hypothetical protein
LIGEVKPEILIEEHLRLLHENIEIKKRIKELLKDLNMINAKARDITKRFRSSKQKGPKISYKAAKGDEVDAMLGDWINAHGCPIKIKRLGGGYYMFGTKKIYAKIMNGKLVIRVGGGYMGIDEFMKHYGAQELQRQQRAEEAAQDDGKGEEMSIDDLMNNDQEAQRRGSVIGIGQMKKALTGRKSSFIDNSSTASTTTTPIGSARSKTKSIKIKSEDAGSKSFLKKPSEKK